MAIIRKQLLIYSNPTSVNGTGKPDCKHMTTRIDQLNPTSRLNHLTHQTTWTESEITEFETLLGELFHLEFFSNLSKTLK